jgi:hypothetical protein
MFLKILAEIRRHRMTLEIEGDTLRIRGPKSALTREFTAALALHKPRLLRRLRAKRSAREAEASRSTGPDPRWLAEALEVAGKRATGCFLCKRILMSARNGELRPSGCEDGPGGGDLFPPTSQLVHLRLECGLEGAQDQESHP